MNAWSPESILAIRGVISCLQVHVTDPICGTLEEKQIGIGSLEPCGLNPARSYGHERERKAQNTCEELMKFLRLSWVQRKPSSGLVFGLSLPLSFILPLFGCLCLSFFLFPSFLFLFFVFLSFFLSFFVSFFSSFLQRVNRPSRFLPLYHFHVVGVHVLVKWKWIHRVKPWQNVNTVVSDCGLQLLACQQITNNKLCFRLLTDSN